MACGVWRWTAAIAAAMVCVGAARAQELEVVGYQGVLTDAGAPAVGSFSIRFRLYDDPTAGALLGEHTSAVVIDAGAQGRFEVQDLPFADLFDGTDAWLELRVTPNSGGSPFTLLPRQPVLLAAQAAYAQRSGTSLQDAYDNGDRIEGIVELAGFLRVGEGNATAGNLRVFGDFVSNQIVELRNEGARGGRVDVRDQFNQIAATMGIDSNDGGRLALTRNSAGDLGFLLDANTVGTQAPRLDLLGPSRSVVMDLSVSGNGSVVLPDASLGAPELLDEPGVANVLANAVNRAIGTAPTTILSRSITVPADGYVLVIGSLEVFVAFTTGTEQVVQAGVSNVSNAFAGGVEMNYDLPASTGSGSYNFPISAASVFPVDAGANTFYLLAAESGGSAANSVVAADCDLSILYVPTAYGTVGLDIGLVAGGVEGTVAVRPGMSRAETDAELVRELRRHNDALAARQRELERELAEHRALLDAALSDLAAD